MVATIDFRVDPTSYAYLQMAEHLRARIESGELEHHRALPAERHLADQYGVSLGTARRATEELRRRGLVCTLRSKGSYVIHPRTGSGEHGHSSPVLRSLPVAEPTADLVAFPDLDR